VTEENTADEDQAPGKPDEKNPAAFADEDPIPPSADGGTTRTLLSLLSRHPFWSLYVTTHGIQKLPVRAWACFVLDVLFRLAVVTILLGVIAAVAWKTLAPLPHF
jgi:hypothetical protein